MPQDKGELLQELMDKYARMYMKLAHNRGVPYDDVEDIVMDAFYSFYKSERFGTLSDAENKLMMAEIVRNKCTDYYRKNSRAEFVGIDECEPDLDRISNSYGNPLDEQLISSENCKHIRSTIEGLKEIWREPVKMYFLEGYSISEICKALELSDDVCRSRLSRARRYLKEELKELWEQF